MARPIGFQGLVNRWVNINKLNPEGGGKKSSFSHSDEESIKSGHTAASTVVTSGTDLSSVHDHRKDNNHGNEKMTSVETTCHRFTPKKQKKTDSHSEILHKKKEKKKGVAHAKKGKNSFWLDPNDDRNCRQSVEPPTHMTVEKEVNQWKQVTSPCIDNTSDMKKLPVAKRELESLENKETHARVPSNDQKSNQKFSDTCTKIQTTTETSNKRCRDKAMCISSLPDPGETDTNNSVITHKDRRCMQKRTFAEKLMDLLSSKNHAGVITWFPEGEAFVILKPDQFTKELLPRFFNETKFECFTDKLFCWGFKCLVGSAQNTAFHHDMFLRDQPELCKQMQSCNIAADDNGESKQAKVMVSLSSDDFDDETASFRMDVGSDKAITPTVQKPEEVTNDSKVSLSTFTSKDLLASTAHLNVDSSSQDKIYKPWLDEALPFIDDERRMFYKQLNMNSIMNLKPLAVRPAETNNSLNSLNSKKLDELYRQHVFSRIGMHLRKL